MKNKGILVLGHPLLINQVTSESLGQVYHPFSYSQCLIICGNSVSSISMHFHGPESVRLHLGGNENIGVGKGESVFALGDKMHNKKFLKELTGCVGAAGEHM